MFPKCIGINFIGNEAELYFDLVDITYVPTTVRKWQSVNYFIKALLDKFLKPEDFALMSNMNDPCLP